MRIWSHLGIKESFKILAYLQALEVLEAYQLYMKSLCFPQRLIGHLSCAVVAVVVGFGAHLWVQVKIKNSKWGVSASMIWVFWNLVVLPVD